MRNNNILLGMIRAGILVIAKLLRISTIKHFINGRDDIIRD